MPLDDVTRHISGTTSDQRTALAKGATAWRKRAADALQQRLYLSPTVLVTVVQWHDVLVDSGIRRVCAELDDRIAEIVAMALLPVPAIGGRLFTVFDQMRTAYSRARLVVVEIGRFVPPDEVGDTTSVLEQLFEAIGDVVHTVVDCAVEGLDAACWDTVLKHVARRDTLLNDLLSVSPPTEPAEPAFERALGLPVSLMNEGDGLSSASRLASAWSRHQEVLEARLRDQLPHLLASEEALTVDVWLHLAGLLAGENPLPAHLAAVAGRDLTLAALADGTSRALDVIADQTEQEAWMLTTHRRLVEEVSAFHGGEHPEDRMGPACDVYLATMEGDVRRTIQMVLGLLGRPAEPNETLAPLEQRLSSQADQMACALLLSCINRNWRNAAAHAQFRWDPIEQRMLLGTELVDPAALVRAAVRAHSICKGFHAGVAVALNRAGNPHHRQAPPTDLVASDGQMLRKLGKLGVEVTKLRREGTTVQLFVPRLTSTTLRHHLIGVVAVGHDVPYADAWEIIQDGRPVILLDAETIAAAESVTEIASGGSRMIEAHAAELVLYAGALLNFGQTPQVVARSVVALATSTILGERKQLRPRLLAGDGAALGELAETIQRVDRGVRAAATLLPRPARRRLTSFLTMLTAQQRRLGGSCKTAANGLDGVKRAWQVSTPIVLPWIVEQDGKPEG